MQKRLWKIGKWFLGIVVGLCLLITLALYIFKDDIINYVVKEVNKNLNAKVSVSKIDLTFWASFPNLSVDFNHVFITDALPNSTNRDTLLYSELIRLKFNPIDAWNKKYKVKKIEVSPGTLQLKIDTTGKENYNILKETGEESTSEFNLELKSVHFQQMRFSYANRKTGQYYGTNIGEMELSGAFHDEKFTLKAVSDLYIHQIKNENITLLANKPASFDLSIEVDQQKKSFSIPKATVFISRLPFQLKAYTDPEKLRVDVSANKLKLDEVANKLSNQLDNINAYQGQGFCNFALTVRGNNRKDVAPTSVCTFDIQNGSLREPSQKMKFSNINLHGKYSNEAGKGREFLKLWDMRFNTATGPFQGEFMLTNFALPHYQGKARGNLDLASIHGLFHIPYIQDISGNLDVNSQFDIRTVLDETGKKEIDILSCTASLTMKGINASVVNDSRTFRSLNGFVGIEGDEAALQDITVKIGNSDFRLNGMFQDIAPYVEKKGKLLANVDLQSAFMDVADLSSTRPKETAAVVPERSFVFPNDIDGTVLLNVGQLKYETHHFNKLRSNLKVGERLLTFNSLSVETAQAAINGHLSIAETAPEYLLLKSELSSDNIYFKNLFREWNNFDQQVIKENNISGKAHADMSFQAPFDLRSGILKKSILARIHIKITDGKLKDVSTFKTITESLKTSSVRYLLKAKNINNFEKKLLDLNFETLENTLLIQNGKLEIPLMEIRSNALDIETFGWHTFENQIDYHFAFRFRDLKTKPTESEFGIIEDDGTGFRVYMRMSGDLDNPVIKWDEEAKKAQAKENREAAKKEAMSILKTEFGWKKGDTTVGIYKPVKKPTEELRIDFGTSKEEPVQEIKKESEIKKKLQDKIRKMKEATKEEVEFEVN